MGTKLSLNEINRQVTKEESEKLEKINALKQLNAESGKIIKK